MQQQAIALQQKERFTIGINNYSMLLTYIKKYFKNSNPMKGFTIIELIAVIAVLLFVVGAAVGIFLSIIQNQKKVLAQQQLLNQISYTEEYMSKALRMAKTAETEEDLNCLGQNNAGYIYLLTRYDSLLQRYKGIKFINQSDNDVCQEFFWDSSDGFLKEIKNSASPVALSSASVQINFLRFSINGSDGSASGCADSQRCGASNADGVQPRATILLNVGISGGSQGDQVSEIQTTVSRRNLNIQHLQ